MKGLIALLLMGTAVFTYAQSNEALNELATYQVTPQVLTMTFNEDWPNVSFERKSLSTTVGDDFKIEEVSRYDASKAPGQKWVMVSVNGETPNSDFVKQLDADKNGKQTPLSIDPATLKKVSDEASGAVYSFKYIEKSIPKNYSYLKDCTSKATINKSSGKLEKIEITNDGPTKRGPLKVSVVKFTYTFSFDASLGQYIMPHAEQILTGKFLGSTATDNTVVDYNNIKKVN